MADPIRLPVPGGDEHVWGALLNAFLRVEHNEDGTLKKGDLLLSTQSTAQKNQPGGYAGLDEDGFIDPTQLPSVNNGVGDYLGVGMFTTPIPPGDRQYGIAWENTTVSFGSSISWDSSTPSMVSIDSPGVYAISLTVSWPASPSGTIPGSRFAQIVTDCMFHTESQHMAHQTDYTIQSLSFTVTMRQGQHVSINLEQTNSTDETPAADLTPNVMMLVTKVAHALLPI